MSNVRSFADAYRRRNPGMKDIADEESKHSALEEKLFYERLPSADYPDLRLYFFAHDVRNEPARLDALLVEAVARLKEHPRSYDAWFAKFTYQLAKDQEYRESMEQVLQTMPNRCYVADCIFAFLKFKKFDNEVKHDVARLVEDLLLHQPLERSMNYALAREACHTILELDNEETDILVGRQEERRKFVHGSNP